MAAPIPAHASTVVYSDRGVKMVAVLNRPAGPSRRRFPAVLFLHGFPGAEKNIDIQRALLKRGVASLSVHFQGAWGSEGYYSFLDLVRQARVALRFLSRQEFVDPRRLGVFGFSMGGWAALNTAAAAPRVKAVAAVAPVGGPEMAENIDLSYLTRISKSLRMRSRAAIGPEFSAAVRKHDPARAAAVLKRPLLLIHGDADDVVPLAVSRRIFSAARNPKSFIVARGARHDFLDRREWLARRVSRWFAERL